MRGLRIAVARVGKGQDDGRAGVKQGEGRIVDCLVDHQQDISEDCYQFLKARQSGKK